MNKYFSLPILVLLFFSTPSRCLFVEPISINDGIWNVLSRVGVVADEILGVTGCRYFVHQIDLPLTINTPGNYCLVQSVTFSGTAVTINSSGVNFDMRNYSMDANFTTSSIAFLVNSGSNISIKNGSIQNTTGGAIIGGPSLLENIVISDVNIEQSLVGIVFDNGMNVESMLIKDCYFSNSDGITIQGSGITVRGCELDDSNGTESASITIKGVSDAHLARHIIVEDCIITASTYLDSNGITIQIAENGLVDNCKVSGANIGVTFYNVNNLRCSNCNLFCNQGIVLSTYFSSTPITAALIENCFMAQDLAGPGIQVEAGPGPVPISNVVIRDCVVSQASDGILLLAGVGDLSGNVKNVSIQRCDFLDILNAGILIDATVPAVSVNNVAISDCVFSGGSFGVLVGGGPATMNPTNLVVTGCTGQALQSAFYNQTTSSPIIFDHCSAQACSSQGFFNYVTSTSCQIINCCSEGTTNGYGFQNPNVALANSSFNDKNGGFFGVPASLVKSGAAAASNAEYWNNVVF